MSFDWNVASNHNNVANYQVSGLPFTGLISFTGAEETSIPLPRVSRWVTLQAVGGNVTIYFKAGNHVNGYVLKSGETLNRLELRCTKIFAKAADGNKLYVIAGLTTCDKDTFIDSTNFDYA
jgi:hypothetical protein